MRIIAADPGPDFFGFFRILCLKRQQLRRGDGAAVAERAALG